MFRTAARIFGNSQSFLALGIATIGAVGLAGMIVTTASRAAFSETTTNTGNSFTAGDLVLTDDDSTNTMFSIAGMVPGQTATKCINITYAGSSTIADPAAVKMYAGFTDSGTFDTYLDLDIDYGSSADGGGTFSCTNYSETGGVYAGTLASLGTDYSSGSSVWDPSSAGETQSVEITVTLNASTPNSQQGESVTALVLTWEVQN